MENSKIKWMNKFAKWLHKKSDKNKGQIEKFGYFGLLLFIGIPLPGITIGIFDEKFNELPYYERGQILANTPCSMLGYYKNEKATNK